MVVNPYYNPNHEKDYLNSPVVEVDFVAVFGYEPLIESPISGIYEGLLVATTILKQLSPEVDDQLLNTLIERVQRVLVGTGMTRQGKILEGSILALLCWIMSSILDDWMSVDSECNARVEAIKQKVAEKIGNLRLFTKEEQNDESEG